MPGRPKAGRRTAALLQGWLLSASATLGAMAVLGAAALPGPASIARAHHRTPAAQRFGATGYFRTARADGRWWLVTPDGHPFYSTGVDHVSADPDTDRKTGICPYCVTIANKYPSPTAWQKHTITRLRAWGFNTLGPWSDLGGLTQRMPYTVVLNMATGDDWFSPDFAAHANDVAATQVAPLAHDPNLLGWYTDSELHWGPDWRENRPVLDDYLALRPGSPGLEVAERYKGHPNEFLYVLAKRYFSVTTAAIRNYDPHHLILGVKAVTQLIQPQLLRAARPYVNVFSVDDYTLAPGGNQYISSHWQPPYLPVEKTLANIEHLVHRPIIIAEYSFRAADSGLPNTWPPTFLFPTYATQLERANAYAHFIEPFYRAAPWVVGDDWFEYVDEPAGGRFDGENSNWGIVSVDDVPYATLVRRMITVHASAPDRRVRQTRHCVSWGRSSQGAISCTAWIPRHRR